MLVQRSVAQKHSPPRLKGSADLSSERNVSPKTRGCGVLAVELSKKVSGLEPQSHHNPGNNAPGEMTATYLRFTALASLNLRIPGVRTWQWPIPPRESAFSTAPR